MPRFFVEKDIIGDDRITLAGENAKHISLSLRMRAGDSVTACDGQGMDYDCVIENITKQDVTLKVLDKKKNETEPSVDVTLYQAFVKSDKFDFIVQKCTELGVTRIVPVIMERCISRPDEKGTEKKIERWNKIAHEAAMQSGRGIVPKVYGAVSYDKALREIKNTDLGFVCYESSPHTAIDKIYGDNKHRIIAFLVGPEGGISESEITKALDLQIPLASLGPRILRTETAPLCAMSSIMLLSGNMN